MTDRRPVPDRPTIEAALRRAGMSSRAAKRLLAAGWAAVVGDEAAEQAEALDAIEVLTTRLRGVTKK